MHTQSDYIRLTMEPQDRKGSGLLLLLSASRRNFFQRGQQVPSLWKTAKAACSMKFCNRNAKKNSCFAHLLFSKKNYGSMRVPAGSTVSFGITTMPSCTAK